MNNRAILGGLGIALVLSVFLLVAQWQIAEQRARDLGLANAAITRQGLINATQAADAALAATANANAFLDAATNAANSQATSIAAVQDVAEANLRQALDAGATAQAALIAAQDDARQAQREAEQIANAAQTAAVGQQSTLTALEEQVATLEAAAQEQAVLAMTAVVEAQVAQDAASTQVAEANATAVVAQDQLEAANARVAELQATSAALEAANGASTQGTPNAQGGVAITQIRTPGDRDTEGVEISNTGELVLLTGWTLEDEQGNVYTFPENSRLFRGGSVTIYTREGQNTPVSYFWGSDESVWESGELVTLRDAEGDVRALASVP